MNVINKINKKYYFIIIALSLLFILLGTNNANACEKVITNEEMNVTIPTEININFDNNGKAFVSDFNIQNNWSETVHLNTLNVTSKNNWNLVPWNIANRNEKDLSIKVNNKDINLNSQSIDFDVLSKEVKKLNISVKDKIFKNKIPIESAYNFNMNFNFDIKKTYELVNGSTFNKIINRNVNKIIFTDIKMPKNNIKEITGLDADGDGGIVAWYDFYNNMYISTQKQGQKVIANKNCSSMFFDCGSLQSIDLSNFDTSKVINMDFMFYNCKSLQSIDLSNFDTSQVIDMKSMFYNCGLLQSIDLSNFDTSKVVNMDLMFYDCKSLQSIDLSNFNTSQVTNMSSMFYNCGLLQSIDLSNFDTSKVVNMESMFYNCKLLQLIDLSNFNTSKVTDMRFMFYNCDKLNEIHTPKNIPLNVNMDSITNKTFFDVDTGKQYTAGSFPSGNSNSIHLVTKKLITYELVDGSTFNSILKSVKTAHDISIHFTNMQMPQNNVIREITGLDADGDGGIVAWVEEDRNLHSHIYISTQKRDQKVIANKDCTNMFVLNKMIDNLDTYNLDTSKTEIMTNMFAISSPDEYIDIYSISNLDIRTMDTSNVKNMENIFNRNIYSITLGNNFKFIGEKCYFPDYSNIPTYDGYWYNTKGEGFLPKNVPNNTYDTYVPFYEI